MLPLECGWRRLGPAGKSCRAAGPAANERGASSEPPNAIVAWSGAARNWPATSLLISYMSRSLVLRNSVAFLVIVTGAGGCATSTRPEPASAPVAADVVTNAACVSDVDSALAVMSRDHAGYRDNASARPAALAAVVDSARRDARRATDGATCLAAIRRLLAFFPDHHLQVGERNPPPAQRPTPLPHRASVDCSCR